MWEQISYNFVTYLKDTVMPIYVYKCRKCQKIFDAFTHYSETGEHFTSTCKCGETADFQWGGYKVQKYDKNKWKETGKGRIDEGIPFGEVPGDEEYMNGDLNDPDYMGPRP